jgi:hypothetical protein
VKTMAWRIGLGIGAAVLAPARQILPRSSGGLNHGG